MQTVFASSLELSICAIFAPYCLECGIRLLFRRCRGGSMGSVRVFIRSQGSDIWVNDSRIRECLGGRRMGGIAERDGGNAEGQDARQNQVLLFGPR